MSRGSEAQRPSEVTDRVQVCLALLKAQGGGVEDPR